MISSLYGANIVQYNPATKLPVKNDTKEESKGKGFQQAVQTQEETLTGYVKTQSPSVEQEALPANQFNTEEESSGLTSVQDHLGKPIPIKNILEDFQSTLNALGADDAVRNEVKTYLGVVTLQAQQSQPHTIFIKQALRSAAGRMDDFITQALGEKSQVVKDWVDALLMQPIDFKGDASLAEVFGSVATSELPASNSQAQAVKTFTSEDKKQLKQLIQSMEQAFTADDLELATVSYQQAIHLTNGFSMDDIQGKLHQRMARYCEDHRMFDQAQVYYAEAQTSYEQSGLVEKQGLASYGMGRVFDESGNRQDAKLAYETALGLLPDEHPALASLNNDYGNVLFVDGEYQEALNRFSQGVSLAKGNQQQEALLSLLSNQGAVYRRQNQFSEAEASYKEAASLARGLRDKASYTQALNALASTYLESNRPQPALKILEKLNQL